MSQADFTIIDSKVGLIGGTALVIGNVIAMTVFLLPAHLIVRGAGPSIALAMVIIALIVGFGLLQRMQIGGAMPTAGGSYVYATRLLHPFLGFLIPWMIIPGLWAGQVYLAFGFADFVRFFELFQPVPKVALMYAIMIPFLVLNVMGIRIVTAVQLLLVGIILAGMLTFIVPGAMTIDTANYTPMFPEGLSPFFLAVVSLSISMNGFGLATSLGEELKDPVKNIPRIIGLSAVISITLMTGVVVVAVGAVPAGVTPTEFYSAGGEAIEAGVAVLAMEFLPTWAAGLVAVAAIVGAFTSINTLYTSSSRIVMRASRDEIIPHFFSAVHPRFDTPYRALLLIGVPPLFLVGLGKYVVELTAALAFPGLIAAVFAAASLWNLPKRFPDRYQNSIYRLPLPVLKGVAIVSATTSLLLLLAVSTTIGLLGALVIGYMVAGYPVYRWRVSRFSKQGVDLPERMKHLHDHEVARAEAEQLGRSDAADGVDDEHESDTAPAGTD